MTITRVFFDIGGVLGTNGWDHEQRRDAAARFAIDPDALDRRHKEVVAVWEEGRMSWDEYLDFTVFYAARPFTREEFKRYVLGLSQPFERSVAAARRLREQGMLVYTLNNESDELNRHRIAHFGLGPIVHGFLSSCWLGVRKPARAIYERALAITGADPACSLFVDDREQNLAPAHSLGMRTLHFTYGDDLEAGLLAAGCGLPASIRL